MTELRVKLHEKQMHCERLQSDNVTRLNELEHLLSEEQQHCKSLEYKYEELMKKASQEVLIMAYEANVQELAEELYEVRKWLLPAEEKLWLPTPLVP